MSKLFVNKSVFWSRNGTKMAGKVKSIMSDHVLVVTPDGTQHIVASNVLSTKPMDKLALLSCSMTKTAAGETYSEEELQSFLVGLKISINLKLGQVKVEAVDGPGAPGGQHSKLLEDSLAAVSGGKGKIRLTEDAINRIDSEKQAIEEAKPIQMAPAAAAPPPSAPPPPPPGAPAPQKKIAPPQRLGPVGM
jgi:hypothetical protein